MPTETLEEVLEHYGILGMRWGVRRSDKEIARANNTRLKKGKPVTVSKDAKEVSTARTKEKKDGIAALSNAELEMVNKRLNLETQYDRLTSERPKEITRGSKIAQGLLKEVGNMSANVARSEGQRILAAQVRKKLLGG